MKKKDFLFCFVWDLTLISRPPTRFSFFFLWYWTPFGLFLFIPPSSPHVCFAQMISSSPPFFLPFFLLAVYSLSVCLAKFERERKGKRERPFYLFIFRLLQ